MFAHVAGMNEPTNKQVEGIYILQFFCSSLLLIFKGLFYQHGRILVSDLGELFLTWRGQEEGPFKQPCSNFLPNCLSVPKSVLFP